MKQGIIALAIVAAALPLLSSAQTRSYHYGSINYVYTIQTDTTIDVEETQTYEFNGTYHQAVRNIPHKGIDSITNVQVTDAETGEELTYSRKKLDKTAPSSWDHYTVYNSGGQTYIEWYYDLSKTSNPSTHTWKVAYTLHGALAFYKTHDELYWNLFTDYDVPVNSVDAVIKLPGEITLPSASFYTTSNLAVTSDRPDPASYHFALANIPAGEDVTFSVGWQKGLVDQSAYWRDFARVYWGLVAGLLIILGTIIFAIYYWRRIERIYKGRGTVIAEYEPPKGLPPAMAEIVAQGHASEKTWAATVVDLAVRGYLTIKEEDHKVLFFDNKNYVLKKTAKDISGLRPYEAEFYLALFSGREDFSLREVKNNLTKRSEIYKAITNLGKHILEQLQSEQGIYLNPPTRARAWWIWFHFIWVFVFFAVFFFSDSIGGSTVSTIALLGSSVLSAIFILYWTQIRSWLNREGHMLREDILGFKLFLEVTQKDRVKNLTPDMFEKFLPYAMVFGVEKEWAEKFEAFNLPQPAWYSSSAAFVGSSGSGSFSPSSFASGFSASFASSFASSGASGASGGGGSAGGGGGGGGGGAS